MGRKILTEIITPEQIISKKLKIENNCVVLREEKPGLNPVGYKATFTKNCLLPYYKKILWPFPFKILRQKLMLIDGADECISFNFSEGVANAVLPIWNRETEERLFKANVLKASGNVTTKLEMPSFFYIMIIFSITISFLTLLVASGRLKL